MAFKVNFDHRFGILGLKSLTSLEHPTVSTLLEHPKYGCSNEVLFLAFLALKMAFKVNSDQIFEIYVVHWLCGPIFRGQIGCLGLLFELR